MCGGPANSREHKIKKSDFTRRYGPGSFEKVGGMVHGIGAGTCPVRGPNAKRLKYRPVICVLCNSTRSQPWDRAYEVLERWIFENQPAVLERRFIDLYRVFDGDGAIASCPALYKYFVKAFGCRLADAGLAVPRHLVDLLNLDRFLTKLRLAFAVHKTMFAMSPEVRANYLAIGELVRLDSRSLGRMERYVWHLQVGWLRVGFYYDIDVPSGAGAPWTSDSACIYLGEIETSTLDELIEGARRDNAPVLPEWEALRQSGGIRVSSSD